MPYLIICTYFLTIRLLICERPKDKEQLFSILQTTNLSRCIKEGRLLSESRLASSRNVTSSGI